MRPARSHQSLALRSLVVLPCLSFGWVTCARAQSASEPPSSSSAAHEKSDIPAEVEDEALIPPRLIHAATLQVPQQLVASELIGEVVVVLTIDPTGRVKDAVIKKGLEPLLDQAVLEAVRAHRFEAAMQGGKSRSSTILFRFPIEIRGSAASVPPEDGKLVSPAVEGEALPDSSPLTVEDEQPSNSGGSPTRSDPPEVVVVQGRSAALELTRSPLAVEVIDLDEEGRAAHDLGEILARAKGVSVQRGGGMGSSTRFSLGGLGGERVRFFVDGVPLEFAGFPYGVANVTVNLIDRVDIYQGVVPVHLGADALGGAVDLITDTSLRRSKASLSYQLGSFNTHSATASAQRFNKTNGFIGKLTGFVDSSANNYPVSVSVTESDGQLTSAEIPLFHSAYLAGGGKGTVGWVDRPWAEKLLLSGFATIHESEVQSNSTMTVPYGEVEFAKASAGATLQYSLEASRDLHLQLVGGYTRTTTTFVDQGSCRYGWRGECLVDLAPIRGEIDQIAVDRRVLDQSVFLRANATFNLDPFHTLRLSVAPTLERRSGEDREIESDEGQYDPLSAPQAMDSLVVGQEWEVNALDSRLGNIFFTKLYSQFTRAEELVGTGEVENRSQKFLNFGIGDSARFFVLPDFYLKASYEFATRQPSTNEVFGDGRLVQSNFELIPERSHNANGGFYHDGVDVFIGYLSGSTAVFGRWVEDFIEEVPTTNFSEYLNIDSVRSLGIDGALGFRDPKERLHLGANFTWQDLRNTASSGDWSSYQGDRIPNHPYLNVAGQANYRFFKILLPTDYVELSYWTRYVHKFYRSWESLGDPELKQVTPSQLTHSIAIAYVAEGDPVGMSHTLEVNNLTDERVYDLFGVQRPGRSFQYKLTLDI